MQFCPTHGLLLVKKRTRYVCPKCGKSPKGKDAKVKIKTVEKMAEKTKVGLLKEKETSVWPVTSATCPKCSNKKAYYWTASKGSRAEDEGEVAFFRCTKCKHTWREYSA